MPPRGLPLTAAIFHPSDNSIAYSTSLSTHLHTHDLLSESPEPISSTPFNAPLLCVTSLHPTSLLALGTTTNRIFLHDPRSQSITVNTLTGHQGFVSSLSPSPDNPNVFSSGSYDSHVRIWDIRYSTGSIFRLDRQSGAGKILSIDWSARGLIAGGQDGKLDIWTGNTTNMAKL
jgi:WD40 repeat protein